MRHGVMHKKLGRTHQHRQALFVNLKKALIEHDRIETTITKAKVLRPMIEKLVTKAKRCSEKKGDLSEYRVILSQLRQDNKIASRLVNHIAKNYANRPGGYTRIVRTRVRDDKTQMAVIEFVDAK